MWRSVVTAAILTALIGCARVPPGTTPSAQAPQSRVVTVELSLAADERIDGAAAGDLDADGAPELAFATSLPGGRGRVMLLRPSGSRYQLTWQAREDLGSFRAIAMNDATGDGLPELITSWIAGSGGYVDIRIFRWDGRRPVEVWRLATLEATGQIRRAASFRLRPYDTHGNVELVVRAPSVASGGRTLGPVAHQVSIYRWSSKTGTLVLHRRYIDLTLSLD